MKIIKVCGLDISPAPLKGICLSAVFCSALCSCASSANIPYRDTLYKITYEYLRAAECINGQVDQVAFTACDRSYSHDFNKYRQLREEFVNDAGQR